MSIVETLDHTFDPKDLIAVVHSQIRTHGLVNHHVESGDNFYDGIKQIMMEGFRIQKDVYPDRKEDGKVVKKIHCEVFVTDVKMSAPTTIVYGSGTKTTLYPTQALRCDKNYSCSISIDYRVEATAEYEDGSTVSRSEEQKDFHLVKLPVLKGTKLCNTFGRSREELIRLGEDPSDPGGFFLVRGGEWIPECTENIAFNQLKIYRTTGSKTKSRALIRCEFISRPGDTYQNSDMVLIQLFPDNRLVIEIARDKLSSINIPFFLLFRAFGWSDDKTLYDHIVMDMDDPSHAKLIQIMDTSMRAKYGKADYRSFTDSIAALGAIVRMIPSERLRGYEIKENDKHLAKAMQDVRQIFDMYCLPHLGMVPSARPKKLRFLAMLIRKLLLVFLQKKVSSHDSDLQTDRDSFKNKRIHAAGENYKKTFKTAYNKTVVMYIHSKIHRIFSSSPFKTVKLTSIVQSAVSADQFESTMVSIIASGRGSTINLKNSRGTIVNRLAAQGLNRKNQLALFASLNQISTTNTSSAKQSERASEMRRVHMSQVGFVDVAHTPPEGENVGTRKQKAITAMITSGSSSEVLKQIVLRDPELIPEDRYMPLEIHRKKLERIFVNGDPLGYVRSSLKAAFKYRAMRRRGEIHALTTVYWDNVQGELYLLTDSSRLVRPLVIVYNTERDRDAFLEEKKSEGENNSNEKRGKNLQPIGGKFQQGIAITDDDIRKLQLGVKTIEHLVKEQKVDYISPSEQENCLICPNYQKLLDQKHNDLMPYTHCDIPQAILGITSLVAPFGNHNQPTRVIYQTTQGKQTCGYYPNWPNRMDKETFLQYENETPLVKTIINDYLYANGCNVMVAIACYTGYNIEDSLIFNRSSVQRGLFAGSKFKFHKRRLDAKEMLGMPPANTTEHLKSANYGKLDEHGIVRPGTWLEEGDVIFAIYEQTQKNKDTKYEKYKFVDKSEVYYESKKGQVVDVVRDHDDEGKLIVKARIRYPKVPNIGDKWSSRSGQKGVMSLSMLEEDMPFTKDGRYPDLIFNPHGMPSRMTCAQLIEAISGIVCCDEGVHSDGTMFNPVDINAIANKLEELGFDKFGRERMMSGMTGEYIDTLVFFGPTYYQRLLKLADDAENAVRDAKIDALTNQPLEGKSARGGLKIGSMEKDVYAGAHGTMLALQEKFGAHSDGCKMFKCRCGRTAIVNREKKLYSCGRCGDSADITEIETSWTSNLLMNELESMGVGVRMIPRPFEMIERGEVDPGEMFEPYDAGSLEKLTRKSVGLLDDGGMMRST
jgi:DNA-directed RNA polymerase beta subunit